MDFAHIPGHKDIISKLIYTVNEGRVSHAQLFAGPVGCGALALALAYAKYVSCENKSQHDSCGVCKSCIKYERSEHPDLHFVFPVVRKANEEPVSDIYLKEWREMIKESPFFTLNNWLAKIEAGNSQGLIAESEAGEIIRKLRFKSFESDYKVIIIWLPEKMHQVTANKLLKLIEEPPDHTLFLLVSHEPDKIIPTILSRCQFVRIPAFKESEIREYIKNEYGLPEEKASAMAHVSNGNMIRAIELAKTSGTAMTDHLDRFKEIMRFAWKRDIASVIGWAERMSVSGREEQKDFINFSLKMCRENFMLTLNQKSNNIVFLAGEEESFSSKFHPFINERNVYSLVDEFTEAYSHIEANGNAKIIFLDLGLKIVKLIKK